MQEHRTLLGENAAQGDVVLGKAVGPFQFVPLVCQALNLTASLQITLLRPESPGAIVTQSGDIDNRLKTLFDALTVPSQPSGLPSGGVPSTDETPFFCLLEDDNLITKVSVETDRLLEPCSSPNEVVLLIKVETRSTRLSYANAGLG